MRLTGIAAAGATLFAVVSGVTGFEHRLLAALALPPLVALVLAGRLARPRLLAPSLAALFLFGGAALVSGEPLHAVLAALAFAAALVACAQTFRGERAPAGAWRDYATLTKPRIMTLLLLTGACGMVVGARGLPSVGLFAATMTGLAFACGGASALKRSTPQNIVIGGAAGAVPPLVGWAAATGNLTVPALFLFLIVFFWTPPHFWALALLIKRDYEAARIPMLPVVRGDRETARQIVWYSLVLVAVTLLPFAWQTVGVVYLAAALLLGAAFLRLAWRLRVETTPARARALFRFSLVYLALLFVLMALDPILG